MSGGQYRDFAQNALRKPLSGFAPVASRPEARYARHKWPIPSPKKLSPGSQQALETRRTVNHSRRDDDEVRPPDRRHAAGESVLPILNWISSDRLVAICSVVGRRWGVQSADAPDLLQDVRLTLWEAGPTRLVGAAWVFGLAVHKAVDRRRGTQKPDCVPPTVAKPVPDLIVLLRARVALLPPLLRRFYMLRYQEGYSQTEIAQRLGVCRSSVRWLERRCWESLSKGT
jgi:DNA-directed RNA polymerase specialized sigma24 family protein